MKFEALQKFDNIVRRAGSFTEARSEPKGGDHPFEARNIHMTLPDIVRELFDNGHYSQATFEAFKFVDKEVAKHAKVSKSGVKLMMEAFRGEDPPIRLTPLVTVSDKDEQQGYKFLFSGSVFAIRNPKGHEYGVKDSPDTCLDHLGFASMLIRRLENAGYKSAK